MLVVSPRYVVVVATVVAVAVAVAACTGLRRPWVPLTRLFLDRDVVRLERRWLPETCSKTCLHIQHVYIDVGCVPVMALARVQSCGMSDRAGTQPINYRGASEVLITVKATVVGDVFIVQLNCDVTVLR